MTAELLERTAVVPDSIEAIEAFRCWTFEKGKLLSLNGGGAGQEWTAGEHLTAKCNAGSGQHKRWVVVRRGMDREKAEEIVERDHSHRRYSSLLTYTPPNYLPHVPKTELPDGFGWALEALDHDCPDEHCSCGIYAAKAEAGVPGGANVYGKVKLWGKVVPGADGYRAQFAYPSEFRVAPELADRPELLAFGVPIVVDEEQSAVPTIAPTATLSFTHDNSSLRRKMIASTVVNCTLAAANLALVVIHLV